ncbi:ABC transporter permease, partial [Streptococcus thermophilus]|nr:ABC transporter permease [Streptococcus thermophilus]
MQPKQRLSRNTAYFIPYMLWIILFVIAPVLLLIYQSF